MWGLDRRRTVIQAIAALVQNANFRGFFTGQIYQGAGKTVCVPGLNCYSCPGAVASCPLGALQNSLARQKFRFPYYIVGLLLFFGALLGRAVCGFLCPFGFLQDLLYKIPFFAKRKTWRLDRPLRYLKYGILLLFVVLLPLCFKLVPFFCKYICPAGTAAGLWLAAANASIRELLGGLFAWKFLLLAGILVLSLLLWRPFCKYLCPLGAIYAPLNRVAWFGLCLDREKCTGCGACAKACGMCVDPAKTPDHSECIRCGACVQRCPEGALRLGLRGKRAKAGKERKVDGCR